MAQMAATLLAIWAIAVAIMSTLGVTGRRPTTSVNGMRRRRAGESDAAWASGLRALYPFTMVSALLLMALGGAVVLVPLDLFYVILLGGLSLVLAVSLAGIVALNRAIRKTQASE